MKRAPDQYADLYPSGFDYLLTAISGVLTSYAVAMAVGNNLAGQIFIILSLLGVWISFAIVRSMRDSKVISANGFIYAAAVTAAFMSARALCEIIPENPFKAQIFVCGALCWMLVFGSFLIWSDQTLLFQSVPSIAIFGLVGCYDTYRDATWMFFGFLLCFATLLARVHGRTMLRQAKESGYSQSGTRVDLMATELQRMRSGPWKWVAGPQWALGSAFVVILFSFVGAPLIRESVQGVTANVNVQSPFTGALNRTVSGANLNDGASLRIGRGPNQLSDLPAFRATLDLPRYMRTAIYQSYNRSGWSAQANQPVGDKAEAVFKRSMERRAIKAIRDQSTIEFAIEPITGRLGSIPAPGEVIEIKPEEDVSVRMDGTLGLDRAYTANLFRGRAIISNGGEPRNAVKNLPQELAALTDTRDVPPAVFDLANRVSASASTDYERAMLIKQEIEKRCKYNLNAAETPAGADPVENFLFESKEGYCDLFASSMATMARSVGIPSRLVTGYFPVKMERDADGRYILHDSERHAWAELFFEDAGWVVFDTTEGAESVPGGELGESNMSGFSLSDLFSKSVDILIGVVGAGVILLSVWAVWRSRTLAPSKSDVEREYLQFSDSIAKFTGIRRNYDQTASEYLASAAPSLKGAAEEASSLNADFEKLLYGSPEVNVEDVQRLRTAQRSFQQHLKSLRQR